MAKKSDRQGNPTDHQRRLGVTFHRTFSLVRPAMMQVLRLAMEHAKNQEETEGLERKIIRELTNLGTIYVEAMPRYCYGSGLLDQQYQPTLFGEYTYKHDRLLEQVGTQWLMHYHLSAPQGPGPAFWHALVADRFRSGVEFTVEEVAAQIADFFKRTEGEKLADRSARATATIFLGSYTKPDGLANLNLIQSIGENRYRVNDDLDPPPTWAVAYAIIDFWKARFEGRTTINLDEFIEGNGIANLFLIGAGKVANILQKMQIEGFVDVFRVAPPYQVVLLRPDIKAVLGKLYEHE